MEITFLRNYCFYVNKQIPEIEININLRQLKVFSFKI